MVYVYPIGVVNLNEVATRTRIRIRSMRASASRRMTLPLAGEEQFVRS